MKGYEALGSIIKELDISPTFGNPGTTELPMLRSIDKYYLTLHDSIAVGMADGYSQYLLKPSLVNLHSVPGLGNSIAFIHTSLKNRAPIIITAGQQDTRHSVYEPLLYGELTDMVNGLVKMKYEVRHGNDIPIIMRRAKAIALTPPMGPVFVSFPMDVMDEDAEYLPRPHEYIPPNLVDEDAVNYVVNALNDAKNPAIVMGYEVDVFNAFKEAEELAEAIGCPVYAEPLAHRSPFNSNNRRFAGDLLPGSTLINMKLLTHDLILIIGGGITLYPYLPSPLLPGKHVISVGFDVDPRLGEAFIMNPRMFMREAAKKVTRKCDYKREEDLLYMNRVARSRAVMGIDYVMYEVRKIFQGFTIVDESISYSPTVRSVMGYGHNKYFTAKSGQLGWALSASLGISIAEKKVLTMVGDGSFMYSVQGLWTAAKYKLPLKIIVLSNGGYNILKSYAKSYYPELETADYLNIEAKIIDIAKGFGIEAETAGKDLRELKWLYEGEDPKLLLINLDRTVQKMFL